MYYVCVYIYIYIHTHTGPYPKNEQIGIKFIIFHNVMIKIKLSYILDSLHTN